MSDNKPRCTNCGKTFLTITNLNRHMRTIHHMEVNTGSVACPACGSKVCNYTHLVSHMQETHDLRIEKEELTFACMEDFNAWKKKIEKETRSLYVKAYGSHQRADGRFTRYRCNRDGLYKDRVGTARKKSLKSQGSCKIEARCPSFILMEEGAANLTVTFYKQHFGHELSLQHLPLSKEDRIHIAGLLESGIQPSAVLEMVRDSLVNSEQAQRIHSLTKKDLHNIARDFHLRKDRLPQDDAVSLDLVDSSSDCTTEISITDAEQRESEEIVEDACKLNVPDDSVAASAKQSLINQVKVLESYFKFQEMSTDEINSAQKDIDVLLAKYKNNHLPLKTSNGDPANKKLDNLGKGEAETTHIQFDHTYC